MSESGFMGRLRQRLGKTRTGLVDNVKQIFSGRQKIDEAVFEDLEETLIQADLGVNTTMQIVGELRTAAREARLSKPEELYGQLEQELLNLLTPGDHQMSWDVEGGPHITLVVGVNGSGKTTTAGKIAAQLIAQDRKVLLAAADTFRAAASDQLGIWSERTGAGLIRHGEGADPASVAYDAVDAALARGSDNLLVDTAGRLHTKANLMEELKKIQRVVGKRQAGAPHEVLLVMDATTGQNGLQQARLFTEALDVTGIVMTKLDGTAKGGVIVAIQRELGIPIKLIGIGEGVEDLHPFDAREFVTALFE